MSHMYGKILAFFMQKRDLKVVLGSYDKYKRLYY